MENTNVAICEAANNEKIVKFLSLSAFTQEFQDQFNNGNVWGVYYENGKLVAQLNEPGILENIIAE